MGLFLSGLFVGSVFMFFVMAIVSAGSYADDQLLGDDQYKNE